MHLKQIYLRGFKTFADPTTIILDTGITAIVGPNGVGKSNIVDALLWAMGEQSPRALRATSLQEVIFAGTEERRPLGMADVTLTFDNSDGTLPTEYVEVAITRRLFRNGQSEFFLNRQPCRLRDIRDLLLDTGLGPGAYSVIGQGEIDAILSVRPEDRRELVEEAAGVRKYRVRRDEAERRLEKTRTELRRLNDIISELDSHIEPLVHEAEKARRYEEIDGRLREVELRLLVAEYLSHQRRRGRLENERANAAQDLQQAREQAASLEAQLADLRAQAAAAAERVDQLRARCAQLEHELQEARRERDLAAERRQAIEEQLATWREREKEAREQAEALSQRLAALEAEADALSGEAAEAEAALEKARAAAADAEAAYQACVREREQRQRLAASLTERISRARQEILDLQATETELVERIQRLEGQLDKTQALAAELSRERQAVAAALDEARRQRAEIEGRLRDAETRLSAARKALDEHGVKLAAVRENLAAVRGAMATLAAATEGADELGDAGAAVMAAAKAGQLDGVLGPVAALMEVPEHFEPAVRAALGHKARWIVVRDAAAARAVLEFVSSCGLGALGLVVLEQATDPAAAPTAENSLAAAVKPASGSEPERLLIKYLLGDTALAQSLDEALRLAMTNRGLRIVTLDGYLIAHGGAEVVAPGDGEAHDPLLARARRLREAEEKRQRLLEAEAAMVAAEARLRNVADAAAADVAEAADQLARLKHTETELSARARNLDDRLRAADAAIADTTADLANLRARLDKARSRIELARQTVEGLQAELAAIGNDDDTGRERELAEALAQARDRAVSEEVRVAQLRQRADASARELQRVRTDHQLWQRRATQAAERVQQLTQALAEVEARLAQIKEVEPIEQQLAAARAEAETEAQRARELAQQRERVEQQIAQARQRAEEAAARMHRAELGLAREEAHIAAITERLQDQYSTTPSQAEGLLPEDFTRAAAEREAEELKARLRQLGPVNLGAPQELERLRARRDYLEAQRADVEAARQKLVELIDELDEAAKEEFLKTFDEVGRAFQQCFERLFGGGETRLELTNPEDPLEGGVEIMVRPPGKRWQNLLLLSGGEKALTATAFVFALLQVRPSPLCVLDEIDAALDASSTDRFIELLKDFAQRSQFIIVTHNPQTITAADMIYGVTMQTPGVSMVLAVELEEAQEMAREARARAKLRVTPAT